VADTSTVDCSLLWLKQWLVRAVEVDFKNLGFWGSFYKKKLKTSKVQILVFLGFF